MARRPGEGSNRGPGGGTTARRAKTPAPRRAPVARGVFGSGLPSTKLRAKPVKRDDPRARVPQRPAAPRTTSTFGSGLPSPGAGVYRGGKRAERRYGRALANTPGVRARLRPVAAPAPQSAAERRAGEAAWRAASPAQRRAAMRAGDREGAARRRQITRQTIAGARGLSPVQRAAIGQTATGPGAALRQAQRVQDAGARRAYQLTALQQLRTGAGKKPYSPEILRKMKLVNASPAERRALEEAGRAIIEQTHRPVKPGRKHKRVGVGPASVDLTAVRKAVVVPLADRAFAGGGASGRNIAKFVGNAATDARNLPRDAVVSMYEAGAAGVEAAQGRTGRAERLAKSLTQGAVGKAVQGDFEGALKVVGEHPLYSALEISGLYGAVGRVAGAGARAGLLGRAGRKLGRLDRADLHVAPGFKTRRSWSKNLITSSVQQGRARRAVARTEEMVADNLRVARAQAAREGRTLTTRQETTIRALTEQKHSPNVARGRRAQQAKLKAADAFTGMGEAKRRMGREEARRAGARALPTRRAWDLSKRSGRVGAAADRARGRPKVTLKSPGRWAAAKQMSTRPEMHVMQVVAEQVTRKADTWRVLRRERARLESVYRNERPEMSGRAQARNREMVAALDAVLKHRDSQKVLDSMWNAAHRYDSAMKPRTRMMERLLGLTPQQAKNAVLRPIAVGELGGKFDHREAVLPHDALRYSTAKRAVKVARANRDKAAAAHQKAVRRQARLGGVQASLRGRGSGRMKMVAGSSAPNRARSVTSYIADVERQGEALARQAGAEARAPKIMAAAKAQVVATRRARVQATKDLRAAERQAEAVRPQRKKVGLVAPDGVRLTPAEIDARLTGTPIYRGVAGTEGGPLEFFGGRTLSGDGGMDVSTNPSIARTYGRGSEPTAGHLDPQARGIALADAERAAVGSETAVEAAKRLGYDYIHERGAPGPNGENLVLLNDRAIMRPRERTPSFVGQSEPAMGASAAFVNFWQGRRDPGSKHRTGDATYYYGGNVNPAAMVDSLVRAQGMIDAMQRWDDFVGEFVYRGPEQPGGRVAGMTPEMARAVIDDQPEGGPKLIAVRLAPAKYDAKRLEDITDALQRGMPLPEEFFQGLVSDRFEAARLTRRPDGSFEPAEGLVGVVDETIFNRMVEHQARQAGAVAKTFQALTAAFRGVVLSTSFKWLTGNVVEAVLRLAVDGVIPVRDAQIGRRLMAEMVRQDAKRAADWQAHTTGGLLIGSADRLSIYRDGTMWDGTLLEGAGHAATVVRQTGPVRLALDGFDHYKTAVFGANKAIENEMIRHAIGKLAREEVQRFTGSWIKSITMSQKTMEQLARGMMDPHEQIRFARNVDEILGQYSRFSPEIRGIINTAAPFLPWYLNAAKFVYWTLPRHHPVKTALLARMEATFEQDIEESMGDLSDRMKQGELRSGIKRSDGGRVNVARYTPFGAFTGEMPASLLDPLLPQFSSIYQIWQGRSWTGQKLKLKGQKSGEETDGMTRFLLGMYSLFESIAPGIQMARRLQEHGETPFDDSTVLRPKTKKGTSYGSGAANRILNPLRPTYLRAPAGAGAESADPVERAVERMGRALETTEDPAVQRALEKLGEQGGG